MADPIQLASLGAAPAKASRLAYIDWMRGLACVVMFQAHCYNSWLSPEARKSALYTWSQLGATLPAPLFLFLAGISMAMVTQKLWEKRAPCAAVAKKTIARGAEIFAMGLLFRVQEFALGYRWSPWTDLLRVDVLNIIGITMVLMGILCCFIVPTSSAEDPAPRISRARTRAISGALIAAALIALATPLLWTTLRPRWLPWPIESYINGVHIFDQPQPWLFPLFPWAAFGFVGLALGFLIFSNFAKRNETLFFVTIGAAGVALCAASLLLDAAPISLYPARIYDYWHTSPNFFLMRCGILLVILFVVYAWCRWGWAQRRFSPMIQLGNTSLLVYWVHIEFVYGRFSILPKGQCGIAKATLGLLAIFLAMLALSVLRTRWRKRPRPSTVLQKGPAPAPATAGS
jgi:uncharacterized membrane protein